MIYDRRYSVASSRHSCYDAICLPILVQLPDGSQGIIDNITERQLSEMYMMISDAAAEGNGYGVDEYPTESYFRAEIENGHTFSVVRREDGVMVGAFSIATSDFYRGNDERVADPIVIVRRSERCCGLGRFLFQTAVQFSKRLGYSGIYTDIFRNNAAMLKIIEGSPGFQRVAHLPFGGKLPDGRIIGSYIYFKDLRCSPDSSCASYSSSPSISSSRRIF